MNYNEPRQYHGKYDYDNWMPMENRLYRRVPAWMEKVLLDMSMESKTSRASPLNTVVWLKGDIRQEYRYISKLSHHRLYEMSIFISKLEGVDILRATLIQPHREAPKSHQFITDIEFAVRPINKRDRVIVSNSGTVISQSSLLTFSNAKRHSPKHTRVIVRDKSRTVDRFNPRKKQLFIAGIDKHAVDLFKL